MVLYDISSIHESATAPRHPPVMHDDTFILPDPLVLLVQSTTMPQPLAPAAVDADMPRHAVV